MMAEVARTGMAVRLKDVAEALGVSISTVSHVLRNRPDVNVATRERVLKMVEQLNYYPNRLAHSLVTQRSHIIGVVVPNLSRPFFPHVLEGIDAIAYPAGYTLVVFNADDDPARQDKGVTTLISSQADGLIIASAKPPRETDFLKPIQKSGVPFVLVDRFFKSAPFVGADDEQIGFTVTQHLIQQGYRAIAHLGALSLVTGLGRYRGYLRALRKSGLPAHKKYFVDITWPDMDSGFDGAERLLRITPRPDAVFAISDMVAIGAMKKIQEFGLRIPEDFGVIGVGNVRYGDWLRVSLSTMDLHPKDVGKTAASMLLSCIEGRNVLPKPVFLKPELIVRDSSRRSRVRQVGTISPAGRYG